MLFVREAAPLIQAPHKGGLECFQSFGERPGFGFNGERRLEMIANGSDQSGKTLGQLRFQVLLTTAPWRSLNSPPGPDTPLLLHGTFYSMGLGMLRAVWEPRCCCQSHCPQDHHPPPSWVETRWPKRRDCAGKEMPDSGPMP